MFTVFEKINRSFLNNLKSEEPKSQIKAHLWYFANSCFYNDKPSPRILRQYRILCNQIYHYNTNQQRKWSCHLRSKTLR